MTTKPPSTEVGQRHPERLQHVAEMLATGKSIDRITRLCASEWGVRRRAVRSYVARCLQDMRADYERSIPELRVAAVVRAEEIAERALAAGDFSAATRALDLVSRLQGTLAAAKVEVADATVVERDDVERAALATLSSEEVALLTALDARLDAGREVARARLREGGPAAVRALFEDLRRTPHPLDADGRSRYLAALGTRPQLEPMEDAEVVEPEGAA